MARQEHTGICHICGEYKKLTYEHIPPEAAFNSQRRKMSTVKELMENKKDSDFCIDAFQGHDDVGHCYFNHRMGWRCPCTAGANIWRRNKASPGLAWREKRF